MRKLIPLALLWVAACEAPEGDANGTDTISEEQAIADAEAMIAEHPERVKAEADAAAPEGETQ